MNINNNLYNLSLNLKTTKKEKEKKEEKKAEVKPEVSAKVPEEKKITASVADIFAEMNKSLVKGPGAPKTATRAEENGIDVAQLISEYNNKKRTLLMNKITDPSEEQLVTAQELLELATRIKGLRPNESTSSADIDTTNWDANWQREIDYWTEFLEPNGGRSIDEGENTEVTYDLLVSISEEIWNFIQTLLDEFGINYNASNFMSIQDGEANVENNRPYQEILFELGQQDLSDDDLEKLQTLVFKFEKMLSDYHQMNPRMNLGKIKHPVFHGIAPCILAPRGLY